MSVSRGDLLHKLKDAYLLSHNYVGANRFSFAKSEFYDQSPEARIRDRFIDDPVWGRK